MSAPMTPAQLRAAFTKWRVPFVEVKRDGVHWTQHERPGAFSNVNGVLLHHTGRYSTVAGMLAMLWNGRPDLPGPLCQWATSPSGKLYLMSAGRANHAGKGDVDVLNALIDERELPKPNADSVDGNARLYGNEIIHPGDRSPYPTEQIETVVRSTAAVCDFHGWSHRSVLEHKEWTHRKVDTSWRGDWRAEVAEALKVGPARYGFPTSKPAPTVQQPSTPTVQQQSTTPTRVVVLYRTPTDTAAYELMGTLPTETQRLRWVQKAEADQLRQRGVHLLILTVDGIDPIWRLPKVS